MRNKRTGYMNRHLYLNQIVPVELFIVSVLAATSNPKNKESDSILHECSLVTNENRLPHGEYRRNGRLKPSSVLCTAITHYVFYIRIKLHIASIPFALILSGVQG
jgi:hypothetical protein